MSKYLKSPKPEVNGDVASPPIKVRRTLQFKGRKPTEIWENGELVTIAANRAAAVALIDQFDAYLRATEDFQGPSLIERLATAKAVFPVVDLGLEIAIANLVHEIERILNHEIRPAIVRRCEAGEGSLLRVEQRDASFQSRTALEDFNDLIADEFASFTRQLTGDAISPPAERAFDRLNMRAGFSLARLRGCLGAKTRSGPRGGGRSNGAHARIAQLYSHVVGLPAFDAKGTGAHRQ